MIDLKYCEQIRASEPSCRYLPLFFPLQTKLSACDLFPAFYRPQEPAILLESVSSGPLARHSIFGVDREGLLVSRKRELTFEWQGVTHDITDHPFSFLRNHFRSHKAYRNPQDPLFVGGALGFFSYDLLHLFEEIPQSAVNDLDVPDTYLLFYHNYIIYDQQARQCYYGHLLDLRAERLECELKSAKTRWQQVAATIAATKAVTAPTGKAKTSISSNFSQSDYQDAVLNVKEYIRAGDVFQVNLSQRLQSDFTGDPFELYQELCRVNPSPFSFFLDAIDFQVVSCSPERLIRLCDGKVDTRPIAGTRRRGRDQAEDRSLRAELMLSPKERAEHIMLVDLERNDLGRVCNYGSVQVDELMALEQYSHVTHIVSNVHGQLHCQKDMFDAIRATFPGGTITGTPKIRCLEIIDELETVRRGVYTGSCGYLSYTGNMDLNIIIRTFFIQFGTAYFQVGGGIVADSDPRHEYQETLHKAHALIQALGCSALKEYPRRAR